LLWQLVTGIWIETFCPGLKEGNVLVVVAWIRTPVRRTQKGAGA
jgi:hypothetical protein